MVRIRTTRKFRNTPTEYNGVRYQSGKEAKYAAELDMLKRSGMVSQWFRQVRVPLKVNNILVCIIVVDFMYRDKDGKETYVEVKGAETQLWRLKWKLFCILYPTLNKHVVR